MGTRIVDSIIGKCLELGASIVAHGAQDPKQHRITGITLAVAVLQERDHVGSYTGSIRRGLRGAGHRFVGGLAAARAPGKDEKITLTGGGTDNANAGSI